MTTKNLAEQTPAEIDEQISELSYKLARTTSTLRWYRGPQGSRSYNAAEMISKLEAEEASLTGELAPLEAEYIARGCWNRAFLVQNHGGHAHRSMQCETCFPDTEFAWMTQLSGKTEEEIIEAIGMTACTVCYPTAPVAQMTAEQRTAHSRAEVEARKAERAAAKLAKVVAAIPRQHAEAIKVDELVNAFGLHDPSEAYKATWPGERFGKGYSNAYSTYSDMARRRAARRAA